MQGRLLAMVCHIAGPELWGTQRPSPNARDGDCSSMCVGTDRAKGVKPNCVLPRAVIRSVCRTVSVQSETHVVAGRASEMEESSLC